MASTPICLACQRPFPTNSALASLPFTKRLAFDPVRGRAWRVCANCGEWNLLGAEDTVPVVEEAKHLMTVSPIRMVDRGIDEVRVGNLELLRVDLEPGDALDADVAGRQQKVQDRQNALATFTGVSGIVVIGFLLLKLLVPDRMPGSMGALELLANSLPIWSAVAGAQAFRRWRLRIGSVRPLVAAAVVMFSASIAFSGYNGLHSLLVPVGMWLIPMVGFVALDRYMPYGWTRLRTGSRKMIRRHEMDWSRLWIDETDSLRVTLPDGRVMNPFEGQALLRDLLDGYSWETGEEAQRAGYQLARGIDPLPRLLEMLRPALMAEPGGLPLGRLPESWRAALDLALAASGGTPGRLTELAEKAREAQEVAAIAESLDRGEQA